MDQNSIEGKKLLCRCLAAVSTADGELDGRETATMMSIVEQVTGQSIEAEILVDASVAVAKDPEAFEQNLAEIRDQLSDDFRLLILNTCIMVGRADSFMIEIESDYLVKIGGLLGFSEDEIKRQFEIIS